MERFETNLGLVTSAFDVVGYRPRDDLVTMLYAEVGFQLVRLSLPDGVTMFLVTARHGGGAPDDPAGQQDLLSLSVVLLAPGRRPPGFRRSDCLGGRGRDRT